MIDLLDEMLRELLVNEIPLSESQVGFRPPDDDWRNFVVNLQQMALNLYLVDVRENRKLRSNASLPSGTVNGNMTFIPAPARVDCHYLVTAWSPAQTGTAVEPTADEHALIYLAMGVLVNSAPFHADRIYGPGDPILATLPDLFRTELPAQVLPVEGFLKQPEFWGTMGTNHRWRPAIYLIVTLPLALPMQVAGPMVTNREARFGRSDSAGTPEAVYQIGGTVFDATGGALVPVGNAWVRVLDRAGAPLRSTSTDAQGRFRFNRVPGGEFQLEFRAVGLPVPPNRSVLVPSASGDYDLTFV